MTRLRKLMLEEIERRNDSHETTRAYVHAVKDFAEYRAHVRLPNGGDEAPTIQNRPKQLPDSVEILGGEPRREPPQRS